MAARAPARPAGKGLNGKIGPVPVKVAIFLVALIGGYLLYRHYKGRQTTSAGSNATPASDSTLPFSAPDSTGGGASGGGVSPPADLTPAPPPAAAFPPTFNFTLSTPAQNGTVPQYGGNVSSPVAATTLSSSQPTSTFTSPTLPDQVAGAFYSSGSKPQPKADIYSTILAAGSGKTKSPAAPRASIGAKAGASAGSKGFTHQAV